GRRSIPRSKKRGPHGIVGALLFHSIFFLLREGLGRRVVAGDDGPEVDVFDGVGDGLGRVLDTGVGTVELIPSEGDAMGGEALVDGIPVVGDDRVDVVVVGVVAERGGDVVAHAPGPAGVGDVADEGPVRRGDHGLLLSVLAVDLSDSACGETEFCGGAGLGAPLPLGGVPLDGFADDAAASGRQLAVDVRLDVFQGFELFARGESAQCWPVDDQLVERGHGGPFSVLVEVGDGLLDAGDEPLPDLLLGDDPGLAQSVSSDELFLVDVVVDVFDAFEDEVRLPVGDLLALPGGPGDAAGLVVLDFEGQEVDQVVEVHAVLVTALPSPAADGDEVFDGEVHGALALLSGAGAAFDAAEEGGPVDDPPAGLFGGADGAVAGPVA